MSENVELEKKGGPNDSWHVVQRDESEEESEGGEGVIYHVINYARHERIYAHDATESRVEKLCAILNKEKF